ncbi:MAG: MBL fold metallo-hydrolase [Clostridia bacterium]|nr:MBL fold metallo-hydrolase [Clostridia bacterium]
MSLTFVSLASGSKGNATLIISDNTAILVDAGISYTAIASALREFGLTPSRLDGVVITHEHGDHIRAVQRISEDTKIYVHPLTARAMYDKYGNFKNLAHVDDFENGFTIGDINVEPFRIPHDAAYPLAYSFECGGARCSVATDIGVPTVGVLKNIKDSSLVLLEANHDVEMLKNGKYPYPLKQRILSNNGHLSNDSAARIVQLLNDDRTSRVNKIVLGHISENNNTEQLAFSTVDAMLKRCENTETELYIAHQYRRSEVFEIK